jgi:hypothetical protein
MEQQLAINWMFVMPETPMQMFYVLEETENMSLDSCTF